MNGQDQRIAHPGTAETLVGPGQDFDTQLPTDGAHRCVGAEVVDMGWSKKFGGWKHEGKVLFQLDECYTGEGDLAGVPMEVSVWFDFHKEDPKSSKAVPMTIPGIGTIMVVPVGLGQLEKGTKLKKRIEEAFGDPATGKPRKLTATDYERFRQHGLDLAKLFVGKEFRVLTMTDTNATGKDYAKIVKMGPRDPKSTLPPLTVTRFTPYHQREKKGSDAGSGGTDFEFGANAPAAGAAAPQGAEGFPFETVGGDPASDPNIPW